MSAVGAKRSFQVLPERSVSQRRLHDDAEDPAAAWLEAAQTVNALPGHESHHVVIDVDDPVAMSNADSAVLAKLDDYMRTYMERGFVVQTVANTILPQALLEDHGVPEFYDVYLNDVFPRLHCRDRVRSTSWSTSRLGGQNTKPESQELPSKRATHRNRGSPAPTRRFVLVRRLPLGW